MRGSPENRPGNQAGVLLNVTSFALVRSAYVRRRKESLPYEALYPVTRRKMLAELGAASAPDILQTWLFLWLGTLILRGLGAGRLS